MDGRTDGITKTRVELLALYNHPPVREGQVKYYTVKVPLRVQNCDEGVKGVEANWLDHMTQHFNNGASLVDGYFHLGNVNDPGGSVLRSDTREISQPDGPLDLNTSVDLRRMDL
ncbi:hypothetical protein FQN60_017230 [Etheostoma spectabile]|uniref:Uncharacterized protein n=1 Tax=Etheostoma spectabile TaxID=54343 RepID=A0A5J5DEX7_9PERO|nr:hypothetical protein FQN60_017230 [Etheostoma spectabile]